MATDDRCKQSREDGCAYHLAIRNDVLELKTSAFQTEQSGVLHSGVFTRELASSLAAGAFVMVVGVFFAGPGAITFTRCIVAGTLFTFFFFICRRYLFHEPSFEVIFRKTEKTIETITWKSFGRRKEMFSLSELMKVRLDNKRAQPRNLDGLEVVSKIALQHGMIIPGFGTPEDSYAVVLDLAGRILPIFSTRDRNEAETLVSQLKVFLRATGGDDGGIC